MIGWTYRLFHYLFIVLIMFFTFFSKGHTEQSIRWIILPDQAQIRLAHYTSKTPQENFKTVILLPGSSSYIERFQETLEDLTQRGYDVWIFDWRGTGGSSRLNNPNNKFHIDRYETYLEDFNYILDHHIKTKGLIILMGVSMGGHLALRFIEQYPHKISAVLLVAPMLNLKTSPFPIWMARFFGKIAHMFGYEYAYAFGQGPYNFEMPLYPEKMPTSDIERYKKQRILDRNYRHLITSGVTFGWLYETFKSMDFVNNPENLKKVKIPVSILQAGRDKTVDNSQNKYLCAYMPFCRLITFLEARHNILIEENSIRHKLFEELENLVQKIN